MDQNNTLINSENDHKFRSIDGESISIEILNDDILIRIFEFLNLEDKIRLRRTNRRWKFLLDTQLSKIKALRIGRFDLGGFEVTSGLELNCDHQSQYHRQQSGTIFNNSVLNFPPDLETRCYTIRRFDHLHRAMKFCSNSITMLSLGQIDISYRLLLTITHNLPKLEHLELIGCASSLERHHGSTKRSIKAIKASNIHDIGLLSLQSFNDQHYDAIYSDIIYNQHSDEQLNLNERLLRASSVKKCSLYSECKQRNFWPNLRHLLVKNCHLLNEFSLCLILAVTNRTLVHLCVESNQNLTGEFLNYCGPKLQVLGVKYCPSIQYKFLEDLIKIKQLLYPASSPSITKNRNCTVSSPLSATSFAHEIYCKL